jgi:exopolyphosphatase/guanosine-5'-triphosphate,3'-diphosphate pyrophosphatase
MVTRLAPLPAPSPEERRTAVVDLGSNTFRLVVFRHEPGGAFRLVDEIREVVRLSAGQEEGRLSSEAVARAARTARLYAAFCNASAIDRVIAVATSAIREATNRDEVVAAIAREGLRVRVISAEEEARYAYLGVVNSTTLRNGLILDVGGGSAQVARVVDRRLRQTWSAPVGAVRMTERFLADGSATRAAVKALRRHVVESLSPAGWAHLDEGRLVGVGGTIRTLAAMAQKAAQYPMSEVHGYALRRTALAELIDAMIGLSPRQRDRLPGLKSDRADIMLAGALVVDTAMDHIAADRLDVSAQGLREGLFYEDLLAPADPPVLPDVRQASVMNVARIYGFEETHARHVARLAVRLLDEMGRMGLDPADERDREILWAAGILHDVGVLVDYNDHHKHSYYLVLNAGLPGFLHRELAMVALLVRSHRKAPPTVDPLGPALGPGGDARLLRLAACLRIAEQLERGRAQIVTDVRCVPDGDTVTVEVISRGDPSLALWAAEREAQTFERAFGRRLALVEATRDPRGAGGGTPRAAQGPAQISSSPPG